MRVAVQSMFPGCPARLTLEASELMRGLPNAVTDDSQPATPPPPPPVPLGGFEERCPACAAEVKLANLIDAECLNGHVWGTLQSVFDSRRLIPLARPVLNYIFCARDAETSHMCWMWAQGVSAPKCVQHGCA
jgi:hypothetical protein